MRKICVQLMGIVEQILTRDVYWHVYRGNQGVEHPPNFLARAATIFDNTQRLVAEPVPNLRQVLVK